MKRLSNTIDEDQEHREFIATQVDGKRRVDFQVVCWRSPYFPPLISKVTTAV